MDHEAEHDDSRARQEEDTEDLYPLQTLLQALLSSGVCDLSRNCNINALKKLLNPLSYEPVVLPYRKLIVLKDLYISQSTSNPWKGQLINRAREIFLETAHGTPIQGEDPAADLLVSNGWLTRDSDNSFHFTERSLVQFSDLILSSDGKYRKCRLCGFLSEDVYHTECKSFLSDRF